jgi:hypothetical protein
MCGPRIAERINTLGLKTTKETHSLYFEVAHPSTPSKTALGVEFIS